MKTKTIGIFVDAENVINPLLLAPVIRSARNSGCLAALVLFGNWDSPALKAWNTPEITEELKRHGAVRSPVPKLRPGKNAADIALTFEAALMTREGSINEVWIISGDSDFTPLVQRLRQQCVHVIIFGPMNTPQVLRNACSSFVLLDELEHGMQTASVVFPSPSQPTPSCTQRVRTFARNLLEALCPDGRGWFHGFVRHVGGHFGFIQVSPEHTLFFHASGVDTPMSIQHLRNGDPVEFKLGRNHKGFIAVHVRRTFALRNA